MIAQDELDEAFLGLTDQQQDEVIAVRLADGRKRREYLERLAAAVDGDLSTTWQAAHLAAFGDEDVL